LERITGFDDSKTTAIYAYDSNISLGDSTGVANYLTKDKSSTNKNEYKLINSKQVSKTRIDQIEQEWNNNWIYTLSEGTLTISRKEDMQQVYQFKHKVAIFSYDMGHVSICTDKNIVYTYYV